MNPMILAGMPQNDRQDYYYTSVKEITDPKKALAKWARY